MLTLSADAVTVTDPETCAMYLPDGGSTLRTSEFEDAQVTVMPWISRPFPSTGIPARVPSSPSVSGLGLAILIPCSPLDAFVKWQKAQIAATSAPSATRGSKR